MGNWWSQFEVTNFFANRARRKIGLAVILFSMKTALDLKIPFEWENRRPVLLEKCLYLPSFWQDGAHLGPGIWREEGVFGDPSLPLAVEFCSGNGEWIASVAQNYPGLNWIAVEKDFYRAKKIWLRIFRHSLPNLFVVCGEALEFSKQYFEPESLKEAWVNFPDPWPKRSHAKHRLIQQPFEAEMRRILAKEAPLTLVTDDEKYSAQMIGVFSSWKSAFDPDRVAFDLPGYGTSYFHTLWKEKEKQIRFHRFLHD